jgi:hypothetical protein
LPSITLEISYHLTMVVLNRSLRSIESRNARNLSHLTFMSDMISSISLFGFLLNISQIEAYDVDVRLWLALALTLFLPLPPPPRLHLTLSFNLFLFNLHLLYICTFICTNGWFCIFMMEHFKLNEHQMNRSLLQSNAKSTKTW